MTRINFGKPKKYVTYSGQEYWLPPMRADIKVLHQVEKQWKSAVKSQKLAETLTAAAITLATYLKQATVGESQKYNEKRENSLSIKGLNIYYKVIHDYSSSTRPDFANDNLSHISFKHNNLKISFIKDTEQSHIIKVELSDKTVLDAHVMPPESFLHKIAPNATRGIKINTIVPGMWIDQALDIGHILTNYITQQPTVDKNETEIRAKIEQARNLAYPDADLDLR